jgi:LytS/YehU family sensor histidine kinase
MVSLFNISWVDAALWSLPPMWIEFALLLSTWYICRMTVVYRWRFLKRISIHLVTAFLLTSIWILLIYFYGQVLDTLFEKTVWAPLFIDALPLFSAVSLSLYVAAVLIHYLVLAEEQFRLAEQELMNQKLLKGEAELRALKATVHPHFLFNSLNILGPLMRQSTDQAQTVVEQLSDFLVYSLKYGKQSQVTLGEEVTHIENYLAVEKARLGDRLEIQWHIDAGLNKVPMLPLTLLPLVENAVKHGIGQCLDGGTLSISLQPDGDYVRGIIGNPYEQPARPLRGEGMGIETLKQRFHTYYGKSGQIRTRKENNMFYIDLRFPKISGRTKEDASA